MFLDFATEALSSATLKKMLFALLLWLCGILPQLCVLIGFATKAGRQKEARSLTVVFLKQLKKVV